MRRLLAPLFVVAGAVMVAAGCAGPAPVAPPTVIVNAPPADSGLAVLLTVALGAAFLAAVAAGGFAWCWAGERRTRRDAQRYLRAAEDAVVALTGYPTSSRGVGLRLAPGVRGLVAPFPIDPR